MSVPTLGGNRLFRAVALERASVHVVVALIAERVQHLALDACCIHFPSGKGKLWLPANLVLMVHGVGVAKSALSFAPLAFVVVVGHDLGSKSLPFVCLVELVELARSYQLAYP